MRRERSSPDLGKYPRYLLCSGGETETGSHSLACAPWYLIELADIRFSF